MTVDTRQPLDAWAILELFGRQKAAGHISEVKIAGKDFVRLQIPADGDEQAETIDYSPDAIYDIRYVDEETARLAARLDRPPAPVSTWSARRAIVASSSQLALGTTPDRDDDPDDSLDGHCTCHDAPVCPSEQPEPPDVSGLLADEYGDEDD